MSKTIVTTTTNQPRRKSKAPTQVVVRRVVEAQSPQRRRAPRRQAMRMPVPMGGPSVHLSPSSASERAACHALALSDPDAFMTKVDAGLCELDAARNPDSALNSKVSALRGNYATTAADAGDGTGHILLLFSPVVEQGIYDGTAGTISDLPGADAFEANAERCRCISLGVTGQMNQSFANNQGTWTFASLDASGTNLDYLAGAGIAAQISNLLSIITNRPKATWKQQAANQPNRAVVGNQEYSGVGHVSGTGFSIPVRGPGASYLPPTYDASATIFVQDTPVSKNVRIRDLQPIIAVIGTGLQIGASFNFSITALMDWVPKSTMVSPSAAPAGGAAGLGTLAAKISHVDTKKVLSVAGTVEKDAEKVAEYAATALGIVGVPGATAAAEGLHAAQAIGSSAVHKFMNWI